jgi:hypothetical protein
VTITMCMIILVHLLLPDLQPVYFASKLKEGNYGSKLIICVSVVTYSR